MAQHVLCYKKIRKKKQKGVQKIHIVCNSRTCAGGHAQTRNVGPSSRILGGSRSGCGIGGRMPRARGGRQPPLLLLLRRRLLPYSSSPLAAAGCRPLLNERLDARSAQPQRGGGQEGRRPGPLGLGLGHGLDIYQKVRSDERIRMFVAIFNSTTCWSRQCAKQGGARHKREATERRFRDQTATSPQNHENRFARTTTRRRHAVMC